MEKKVPLRTCVVTKEKLEKKDLIRVVKDKDGNVFVDETLKANGRGAYIKKSMDALNLGLKNKALDRALETTISEEVYDEIKKYIER